MQPGGDGNTLHGGGYDRYRKGGFLEGYQFHSGRMFAGMVVVEFMLADEGPGDGGVAVVQGSHKSNYAAPLSLKTMERWQQHVTEVNTKRGDALIFCEACIQCAPDHSMHPSPPQHTHTRTHSLREGG
jgi:hypothetical protein